MGGDEKWGQRRKEGMNTGITEGELYPTFSFRNQSHINRLKAYDPAIFFNSYSYEAVFTNDMEHSL